MSPTSKDSLEKTNPAWLEAPADPLLGTQVGSYLLTRCLGQGGMGVVYLGEHPHIGSKVAVKFLHASLASDPTLVKRFFAEARAANLVASDHVVRVFDLSLLPPDRHYFVMEYLEGRTLQGRIEQGPLPLAEAGAILLQLCEALHLAHRSGVVHRDLKPENVFLVERGQPEPFVKVMDFGIAKLRAAGTPVTAAGSIIGTPDYMAPEQAAGGEVDARADLYSLGVIAYELVTGRRPFSGRSPIEVLLAHARAAPAPPGPLRSDLSPIWEAAILKALAKRPEERHPDLAAFAAELRAGLEAPAPQKHVQTPSPVAPRLQAVLPARVQTASGPLLGEVLDLSRGGAFLACAGPMPALLSRVRLALQAGEPALELEADVVRHVSAQEAEAWRMRSGFAVQFADLSPEQRQRLGALLADRPGAPSAPAPAPDAAPCPALEYFRKRVAAGHYELLGVARDAGPDPIRARAAALRAELDQAAQGPLSAQQAEQVRVARARVVLAEVTLCTPRSRLDYDAQAGNYLGVAWLLEAGVSRELVAARHAAFQKERPDLPARIAQHLGRVRLARGMGNAEAALHELEAALALSPLDLALHDARAALRRGPARPGSRP